MRLIVAIGLFFTMSACSGGTGSLGRLNPFTWFGGAAAQTQGAKLTLAPSRGYGFAADTRPLVDQITSLSLEKTATGILVRATALTPAQGFHSADLVRVTASGSSEITLQFRARSPGNVTDAGPPHLRELVAVYPLSTAQLHGIRRITVIAARNSRSARP